MEQLSCAYSPIFLIRLCGLDKVLVLLAITHYSYVQQIINTSRANSDGCKP